jgi:hypothetical protein
MFTNYSQAAAMYERYIDELYEQQQEEEDEFVKPEPKDMTDRQLVLTLAGQWDAELDFEEDEFGAMLHELKRRFENCES